MSLDVILTYDKLQSPQPMHLIIINSQGSTYQATTNMKFCCYFSRDYNTQKKRQCGIEHTGLSLVSGGRVQSVVWLLAPSLRWVAD